MDTKRLAKEILDKKGIKPSLHRLKIFEYLSEHPLDHPTVDTIYQNIHSEIPTLSKTTIYNTLKTFIDKKLIRAITIEDNEVRFDVFTNPHAHLKCVQCNNLYNVNVDSVLFSKFFKENNTDQHDIFEAHIYLRGICNKCLDKQENFMYASK